MEVKICQQTKEYENSGLQTSIFETESVNHEFIRYENLPQFNVLVKSRTANEHLTMYGIPSWMIAEKLPKNECESGYFLLMSFFDDNDYSYIVCKNSIIYITNKGQTIDKIIVE
jgi:hypothetical protein